MDTTTGEDHASTSTPAPSPLDIIILSFGTRGDVLPYVGIAQALAARDHRVRITVPPSLEAWVRDEYGLETWSLGHDMAKFIRFGLYTPGKKAMAMVNGEYRRLVRDQSEMFVAHWRASIDQGRARAGERPFVADAIIASPPGMSHVHIAQRLGVPLFLAHFNPKTPTRHWPHSEKNPSDDIFKPCDENRESWNVNDARFWKLYYRRMVNKLRERHLGLEPLSAKFWPLEFQQLRIPTTYLISPHVLPRPDDFPDNHQMAGFVFPDTPKGFKPDPALVEFLSGPGPIVCVDFGSNVYEDKRWLTFAIVGAVKAIGARAVIRKAWFEADSVPEGVFVTSEVPHSWLFSRVGLVLHSSGAGVTAMVLKSGVPSAPMPMKGDQYMWSKKLEQLGASPQALYIRDVTQGKLAALMKEAMEPKYRLAAKRVAEALAKETDGATTLVDMFHEHLSHSGGFPRHCSLLPDRHSVWTLRRKPDVCLSALAAHILDAEKVCRYDELDLLRIVDWENFGSLKRSKVPRNPASDIVRKQRIAQGMFDSAEAQKRVVGARQNGSATGPHDSNGMVTEERSQSASIQVLSRWRTLVQSNGAASK